LSVWKIVKQHKLQRQKEREAKKAAGDVLSHEKLYCLQKTLRWLCEQYFKPGLPNKNAHLQDVDEDSPEDEEDDPNSKAYKKRQQRQVSSRVKRSFIWPPRGVHHLPTQIPGVNPKGWALT
jgi:hypothetical protein